MILHKLSAKMCIKNAKWQNGELRCSKCKEPIAIRYLFDGKMRIFVFQRFKKYKSSILKNKATQCINYNELVKEVSFVDIDEFISAIKKSISDITSFREGVEDEGNEIAEDTENRDYLGETDREVENIHNNIE